MSSQKKLRVLHALKSSVYSGAENVVITIMHSLSGQFEFIYVATDGPIRETLEKEKLSFCLLPSFNRKNLSEAIKKYEPDIVHAHDFSATVLCASLKGTFRLISHLHYDPPWVRKWNVKTITYAWCRNRIDHVLAVSGKSFSNMVFSERYRDKLTVVGNPMDREKILRLSREIPEELENQNCDLIFVGRLVEQKNPQRFIRLVASLKEKGFTDVKAWMLGSGELEAECRQLIESCSLQNNVELKGFQKNPYPYISHARLLCMTSRWEGFGLVLLEANILGVPAISTRTAGAEEVLGETAEELCDGDEEMAEKAISVLEGKEEYCHFAEMASQRVEHLMTLKSYMNKIECIYEKE